MTSPWSDDDELLAALANADRTAREVPPDFRAAARAAYGWRDIDAELAALTYDSAAEPDQVPVGTRAGPGHLRVLTFVSPGLVIELEAGQESLRGQLVPAEAGHVDVQLATGETSTATVDEVGYFVVHPVPAGRFRLRCRTAGADVVTGWLVL
jgi:hypothetical protein